MPSNITITVTAQTAQAAAALQQFAAQSAGALNVVASGSRQIADEADKAATHIRGMAYTFRSGIDAIRFGLAGGGDRALFYAADEGLRALLANGMKLGQLVPILGAVGAAAGAGYLVWDIYAQKQRAVTEAAIAMQKALLQLPDTLKNVQDAANTGVIGQGAADTLAQMLTGKKSYTVSMPASQALTEGRISQDQFDAARAAASRPSGGPLQNPFAQDVDMSSAQVSVEANLAERTKMVNDELVKQGYLIDELDAKGKETGKYKTTPAGEALLEEAEMQKKLQLDALSGIDRERAAAQQKYHEDLDRYKELERIAGTNDTTGQSAAQRDLLAQLPALKAGIEAAYQNALQDIDQKDQKTTISPGDMRTKDAQNFTEKNRQIEDSITAKAQASGKEREKFYQEEYTQRIALAQEALYSGEISEDQYRDAVSKATEEMTGAQEKLNEKLQREADLRQEIAKGKLENQLKGVEGNPFLTDQKKTQQSIPLYQSLMGNNWDTIARLSRTAATSNNDSAALEAREKILSLMQQQEDLQQKINQAEGQSSFTYQLRAMATQFQNIKTLAQDVTDIFSGGLTAGMNAVASNLTKAVMGTESWHRAVLDIEKAILGNIIEAIIKAAEQWVVSEVMKYTLGEVLKEAAVAGTAVVAAEEAAIWWTPAILSAIASAGVTADDASAQVGGAILGFAEGGRPEPGKVALVGERGPELWVPDSAGTVVPSDRTAAMMQGRGTAQGMVSSGNHNVNIHMWDHEPSAQEYLSSAQGQNHVKQIVRNSRISIGVQT